MGYLSIDGHEFSCLVCGARKMHRQVVAFRPRNMGAVFVGMMGTQAIAYACVECGHGHLFFSPDDEFDG